MSDAKAPPARHHRAHLALRLLAAAIEADALGDVSVWTGAPFGTFNRDYARFLGETLLRIVRKPPNKARYELSQFANRLDIGRGRYSWRGEYREFAATLAASVRAMRIPQKPRGNPNFKRGNTGSAAQRRINETFDALSASAERAGYRDWSTELNTPGRAGKPSRGRGLVVRRALHDGLEVDDPYDAAAMVRERLKSDRRAARRASRKALDE